MINRNVLVALVLGSACLAGRTAAEPLNLAANTDGSIARQWDLNLQFYGWGGYGYGPPYVDRFEPWWQRVPGYMWGYREWPIEQPIGHQPPQTGPNRWIYRPLYTRLEELPAPGRGNIATSTGVGPQLPATSEPVPNVFRPAGWRKNKRPPGPREF